MKAIFSITACDRPSLSFSRSSSDKASTRFLSVPPEYCVLESQILNLLNVLSIYASNFCPLASLPVFEIIVARPLSCLAREVGAPVLDLIFFSSGVNARHSGLVISSDISLITIPQLPQKTSPDSESVIISTESLRHTVQMADSFLVVVVVVVSLLF